MTLAIISLQISGFIENRLEKFAPKLWKLPYHTIKIIMVLKSDIK